jgi:hypothetical protein
MPLWRRTSNWWRVDADEDVGVPELDRIQNSKLLIQNFAARAECAFPRDHGVFYFGIWILDDGLGRGEA